MASVLSKLKNASSMRTENTRTEKSAPPAIFMGIFSDGWSEQLSFANLLSFLFSKLTYSWVLAFMVLAALFYGLLASDRYVTVSQVYVKSSDTSSATTIQLPTVTGLASGSQDSLLMQEYILSSDMLRYLDNAINLKQHYSNRDWDFLTRLKLEPTQEEFLEYFRSMVSLSLDPESNILMLEVQAFTAEMSLKIAQEINRQAESFINRVSQKIALDEIAFVEQEMNRAKTSMNEARGVLLAFQNENNLLNPNTSSQTLQGVLNQLQGQLAILQSEEKAMASYLNETAAELVALRDKILALEQQMAQEQEKLTGQNSETLNDVAAEYQMVQLDMRLASDLYQSTLVGYEQARVDAYRKLKHLVVVQSPSLPDEALYPQKIYNLISLFVFLSLAYGIISMILATIREHRDV